MGQRTASIVKMTKNLPTTRSGLPWRRLKRCLLLFWAVWLSLVVTTNVTDGLKALGTLPVSLPFASGNYQTILEITAPFGPPAWLAGVLFAGVIAWEAASMALFGWTGLTFQTACPPQRRGRLVATFAVGLSLWAAFQIACEALPSQLSYQIEGTHRGLFTAQLATLLAVMLLPDD